MPELLPFGEWRPDVNDTDGPTTKSVTNVVPRADGYGPVRSPVPFSAALAAQCRGYFYARNTDNTITIFAGTATKLYMLNNTTFTWIDVSQSGGTYTSLNADALWSFEQFGSIVIAVQANANPQKFTLAVDTAFSDLGGTPPKAARVSIVNRFVVLSGLTSNAFRIQWSGLNDSAGWTSGVNSSDFQDEPDGGIVRAVIGGEFGTILQDQTIRRMTFSPGSDVIFEIQRVAEDLGVLGAYSISVAGEMHFFLTPKGFYQLAGDGTLTPIGEEKVDRTFLGLFDAQNLQLVQGAADPNNHLVFWTCKSAVSSVQMFDTVFVYNFVLQRWARFSIVGEAIATLAAPGLTMEGLDAIAPGATTITGAANNGAGLIRLTVGSTSGMATGNRKTITQVLGTTEANGTWLITVIDGTHLDLQASAFVHAYVSGGVVAGSLDLLTLSLDAFAASALPAISVCDTSHAINFLSGTPLEATLDTPEQSGKGQRVLSAGFYPVTDADVVMGSVSIREKISAARAYTGESASNDRGYCDQLWSTRFVGQRIRIPAGQKWTYASGVIPETQPDGFI